MDKTSDNLELQVMIMKEGGCAPVRSSPGAAGYDLFCCSEVRIEPMGRTVAPTGIALAIPEGYYGRVAPRSGLAVKFGIDVGAGVVDSDYRGEIGVVLFNHSDKEVVLTAGSRVAQLIIERIATPPVRVVSNLSSTTRGSGGFGSTGLSK